LKYWFDTEYLPQPFSLELVSIGVVAEDGREFYAESNETDWSKANQWALQHIRPQLRGPQMSIEEIGYGLRAFVGSDADPSFWAFYAAFDWVAFCGVFGSLTELPFGFPQHCMDLKQWAVELGNPRLPPPPASGRHHALADSRWTREIWLHLDAFSRRNRGFRRPA